MNPLFDAALFLLLFWEALTDVKRQEISLVATCLLGLVGLARIIILKEGLSLELLLPFVPGLLLIGLSFAAEGGLGLGDGLVALLLGFWFSLPMLLVLLSLAFFLAALCGAALLLKKKSRKTAFPFLPFLFGGAVLLLPVWL